jgi:hypothetical protein
VRIWDCYFDTAGTESAANGTVLVTVGVVAERDKWTRFDRRWLRILEDEGVRGLHMREFAHSTGQYKAWKGDEPRRAAFLQALIGEIKRSINTGFVSGLVLPDYRTLDKQYRLTEAVGGPYSFAQAGTMARAFDWLWKRKHPGDGIGFFIEKGDAGQNALIPFMQREWDIEPLIVPRVNTHGEEITPFQVADFIAYEHRYAYDKFWKTRERTTPRKSMSELRRMLPLNVGMLDATMISEFCEKHVPLR